MNFSFFTVFLKNRNISSKIKRSKVTDYAALSGLMPSNMLRQMGLVARKSVFGGFRTTKAQTSLRMRMRAV